MIIDFYQHLPLHISPIAFAVGSFSVRWYSVSYLIGFLVVYGLLKWRIKNGEANSVISNPSSTIKNKKSTNDERLPMTVDNELLIDFLLVSFFAALVGGRLGYVLLYNFSYFLSNPWAIISPFANGKGIPFGFYGMSYHGALVGVIVAAWIFSKIKKIDFWLWTDFIVPAVAAGYFFGRVGNFLNGELYGRVTNSPWGMYFFADQNHLRFPSQLMEAFLEGMVLFLLLWRIRNDKLPKGSMLAVYLMGYGFFRIVGEFFREPDPQLGFVFFFLTMGQLLSLIMLVIGIIIFLKSRKK